MERTHRFVGEGLPIYLALLQSTTDQDTLRETLSLLSCFRELNSFIVPVVTKLFAEATDPHAKVWTLDCLSTLLDPQSPSWEIYHQLVNTDSTQIDPKIRSAAAYALARYHRGDIPSVVVDILVEEMLQVEHSQHHACSRSIARCSLFRLLGGEPLLGVSRPPSESCDENRDYHLMPEPHKSKQMDRSRHSNGVPVEGGKSCGDRYTARGVVPTNLYAGFANPPGSVNCRVVGARAVGW